MHSSAGTSGGSIALPRRLEAQAAMRAQGADWNGAYSSIGKQQGFWKRRQIRRSSQNTLKTIRR